MGVSDKELGVWDTRARAGTARPKGRGQRRTDGFDDVVARPSSAGLHDAGVVRGRQRARHRDVGDPGRHRGHVRRPRQSGGRGGRRGRNHSGAPTPECAARIHRTRYRCGQPVPAHPPGTVRLRGDVVRDFQRAVRRFDALLLAVDAEHRCEVVQRTPTPFCSTSTSITSRRMCRASSSSATSPESS